MRKNETIVICLECGDGSEVVQKSVGDEGWGICQGCQTVEGETDEITVEEWEERFG